MEKFNIYLDSRNKVFSPKPDISPIEAVRISQLFTRLIADQLKTIAGDDLTVSEINEFLEAHNLNRHFIPNTDN